MTISRRPGKAIVLSLFIPLVISSGGNAGRMRRRWVIRALALGEFKLRDWWRIMRASWRRPDARPDPRRHRVSPHHHLVALLPIYDPTRLGGHDGRLSVDRIVLWAR